MLTDIVIPPGKDSDPGDFRADSGAATVTEDGTLSIDLFMRFLLSAVSVPLWGVGPCSVGVPWN